MESLLALTIISLIFGSYMRMNNYLLLQKTQAQQKVWRRRRLYEEIQQTTGEATLLRSEGEEAYQIDFVEQESTYQIQLTTEEEHIQVMLLSVQ